MKKQKNGGLPALSLFVWDEISVTDLRNVCIGIDRLTADLMFGDFESKTNLIGLYDLLLKIDRRNNPNLYA